MNVLSLFDGMSCLQIALKKAGIKVDKYFASEIDKYAMKVTQANFPETIQVGNVEFVTKEMLNNKIQILAGGSPCQGFSFAGKQLNFEDPRSKLFFEFVRLKRELKPKYFFLENVKMKKEYQDIISSYLGCEPIIINSSLISAQNRKENEGLQHIDSFVVNPSHDFNEIAVQYYYDLPLTIRILLRSAGIGNDSESSIISYLLFEKNFCGELIKLGFADAMEQEQAIRSFLDI